VAGGGSAVGFQEPLRLESVAEALRPLLQPLRSTELNGGAEGSVAGAAAAGGAQEESPSLDGLPSSCAGRTSAGGSAVLHETEMLVSVVWASIADGAELNARRLLTEALAEVKEAEPEADAARECISTEGRRRAAIRLSQAEVQERRARVHSSRQRVAAIVGHSSAASAGRHQPQPNESLARASGNSDSMRSNVALLGPPSAHEATIHVASPPLNKPTSNRRQSAATSHADVEKAHALALREEADAVAPRPRTRDAKARIAVHSARRLLLEQLLQECPPRDDPRKARHWLPRALVARLDDIAARTDGPRQVVANLRRFHSGRDQLKLAYAETAVAIKALAKRMPSDMSSHSSQMAPNPPSQATPWLAPDVHAMQKRFVNALARRAAGLSAAAVDAMAASAPGLEPIAKLDEAVVKQHAAEASPWRLILACMQMKPPASTAGYAACISPERMMRVARSLGVQLDGPSGAELWLLPVVIEATLAPLPAHWREMSAAEAAAAGWGERTPQAAHTGAGGTNAKAADPAKQQQPPSEHEEALGYVCELLPSIKLRDHPLLPAMVEHVLREKARFALRPRKWTHLEAWVAFASPDARGAGDADAADPSGRRATTAAATTALRSVYYYNIQTGERRRALPPLRKESDDAAAKVASAVGAAIARQETAHKQAAAAGFNLFAHTDGILGTHAANSGAHGAAAGVATGALGLPGYTQAHPGLAGGTNSMLSSTGAEHQPAYVRARRASTQSVNTFLAPIAKSPQQAAHALQFAMGPAHQGAAHRSGDSVAGSTAAAVAAVAAVAAESAEGSGGGGGMLRRQQTAALFTAADDAPNNRRRSRRPGGADGSPRASSIKADRSSLRVRESRNSTTPHSLDSLLVERRRATAVQCALKEADVRAGAAAEVGRRHAELRAMALRRRPQPLSGLVSAGTALDVNLLNEPELAWYAHRHSRAHAPVRARARYAEER
jgi:hypothetical protein